MSPYDLNGKVALVTGAARGIGFETARQMHLRGASVAVLDLDAEEAREAAERIGPRAIGLGGDVTDQGAMLAAVAEVVEKLGGLDLAVANAGIAQKQFATARGHLRRGMGTGLRGRPAGRLAHRARGAAADRRAPRADGRRLLRLRLRQRHGQHALRGRQGRGRGARPLAAGGAGPHGASASVAYFGWVDTKLVQDAFAKPRTAAGSRSSPRLPAEADHARPRPAPAWSAASRNGPRASSSPSGGATSPPSAAWSTPCSTAAWRATPRPGADPRPRREERRRR